MLLQTRFRYTSEFDQIYIFHQQKAISLIIIIQIIYLMFCENSFNFRIVLVTIVTNETK